LRLEIAKLPSVDLRPGCEVIGRTEEPETVLVEYKDCNGDVQKLRAKWLVGADGKGGIVRKRFLEPEGIKQGVGLYVILTPLALMTVLKFQKLQI
jgi:2-polyprenyl-6-methoxyphenol hydroxylase-like FAD-dependent oxidoreductase